ncbi:ribose transport system permease protein [Aurantimicrobium minutum]|uniref:ABC transporter permease n=1 Tax=Aurantimicrobium minutum TaxID=708131 RepID=UPI002476480F|nr:ABC transporter permease [Aurantimicrobium minutum]MDH6533272.1 ribose transport system permease protein [Aurantimicrobium minutum]
MRAIGTWFKGYLLQFIVLVIVLASMYAFYPRFHVESSIERIMPLGVVAAGLAVTMIAGEFDLSIASMAAFSGALTIVLSPIGLVPALIISIIVGTALGALQGWAIAKLGINSLVFTIGTLILFRGLTWVVTNGVSVRVSDVTATDVFRDKIGFLTPLSLTGILIFIALGIFLAYTRWGREIYALGGARNEAIAAGVRYKRGMIVAFAISGGLGAVAGGMTSALGGSASPTAFGSLLLGALAVVLVGGISLAGGRGTMVNVFLGFAIIAILSAGLSAMGAKAFVAELFTGVLLLVVLVFDYLIGAIAENDRKKKLRKIATSEA